ncbi:MAG: hypothetical protein MJ237_08605, partial [bacterium]|nr:hypothetical protein [bacterium]
SANASAQSAQSSANSATSSANSASQSQTYANNSSISATQSANSASASAESEANAKVSEDNAKESEENALTYSNNASTSATQSANSASASATSASQSANSASASATSASEALASKNAAKTSEDNAKASEEAVAEMEDVVAGYVESASASASDALASKNAAKTSEDRAHTFAQSSATSATNAQNSASASATSASQASASATSAEASAESAQEALENLQNTTVSSTTLSAGSSATATKTVSPDGTVNIAFGIPQGIQGEKGEKGEKGEGSLVIANPTGDATGDLSKISIDGNIFNVAGGGGGSTDGLKVMYLKATLNGETENFTKLDFSGRFHSESYITSAQSTTQYKKIQFFQSKSTTDILGSNVEIFDLNNTESVGSPYIDRIDVKIKCMTDTKLVSDTGEVLDLFIKPDWAVEFGYDWYDINPKLKIYGVVGVPMILDFEIFGFPCSSDFKWNMGDAESIECDLNINCFNTEFNTYDWKTRYESSIFSIPLLVKVTE